MGEDRLREEGYNRQYSSYVPLRQRNYAAGLHDEEGGDSPLFVYFTGNVLRFGLARGTNFACLGALLPLRGFVLHLLALVQ